ncbi:hypothetical protein D3C76_786150 [compost metagenome]
MFRFFPAGRVHQRQGVFGQVRGDARVDELDLVRLALERRVQASAQHAEVALVDQADGVFLAGEPGQEAIAEIQFVDQRPALRADLPDFPLAAAVEQGQLAMVPLPFVGQALQQRALPALGAPAVAGELAIDLQVQRPAHQLQAFRFIAGDEVFGDAPIDHDIGVQLIEVEPVGEHRLLEAQAQALDPGVFAGVHLGQQEFEHRFVRRLDALEQLPEPGPNEFPGRNVGQMAQVQGFVCADEALGRQRMGVAVIVGFLVHRHQPPNGRAPGQPDRGAIKLVQQQVMLGGTAVFGAQLAVALTAYETDGVDQEEVRLGALAGSPGFQQLAFPAQLGEFVFAQIRTVADPHVHIALLSLGQGTEAAHQEQAMNRSGWIAAVARLIGKGTGQALGFGEDAGIRLEIRQPGGRAARDVTRQ